MLKLKVLKSTSSQYFIGKMKEGGLYKVHSIFNSSFNIQKENVVLNINNSLKTLSSIGLTIPFNDYKEISSHIKVGDIISLSYDTIIFYCNDLVIKLDLNFLNMFNAFPTTTNINSFKIIEDLDDLKYDSILESDISDFQQLVGRGNGFTPSGDDYLWGYFMILQLNQLDIPHLNYEKTTLISKKIYERMYKRQWGWIYVNIFESDNPLRYIDILKTYGHSSGMDTLFGMQNCIKDLKNK